MNDHRPGACGLGGIVVAAHLTHRLGLRVGQRPGPVWFETEQTGSGAGAAGPYSPGALPAACAPGVRKHPAAARRSPARVRLEELSGLLHGTP